MIPEETNPTQTRPEEPLPPTFVPAPETTTSPEPLDDGTFTPPHGDPLGEAALEPSVPSVPPPASREYVPSATEAASSLDSGTAGQTTAESTVITGSEQPELLYVGPVEPAPAGVLFSDPEPESRNAEPADQDAVAGMTHAQPELLYAGPVEAAPTGIHLPETAETGGDAEPRLVSDEHSTLARPALHDDLEAAALVSGAVAPEAESPVELEEQPDGGPNWMLAFICAWSSAISLREAWATIGGGGFGMALRNLGVMGYLLLGVGLLAFALDALRWGRPRRGVAQLMIPTLLTLAGVVCLVLWNDRGRPI